MRKILSLVAVAAIAYGVVSVAAAGLTVTQSGGLPQAGTTASVSSACASSAAVTYDLNSGNTAVEALVVTITEASQDACAGATVALSGTGTFGTIGAATGSPIADEDDSTKVVSFALSGSGAEIGNFAPTAFSVAVY